MHGLMCFARNERLIAVDVFNPRPGPILIQEVYSRLERVRIEDPSLMRFHIFVASPNEGRCDVTRREALVVNDRRSRTQRVEIGLERLTIVNASHRELAHEVTAGSDRESR